MFLESSSATSLIFSSVERRVLKIAFHWRLQFLSISTSDWRTLTSAFSTPINLWTRLWKNITRPCQSVITCFYDQYVWPISGFYHLNCRKSNQEVRGMCFISRSRQSSVTLGGTGECAPFACFRIKMFQFNTSFIPLKCSILEVTHVFQ